MLKPLTLLVILLLTAGGLSAQLTLGPAYFPAGGDTLAYSRADSTFSIDLLTPGANRQWDFGSQAAASSYVRVVEAVSDTLFPDADVRVALDGATSGFYSLTDTAYSLVGLSGDLAVLGDYTFNAPVSPARPERRAPLTYEDAFVSNTKNVILIPRDSIPDEAFAMYGQALASLDTLRITSSSNRTDVVDAYGTLTLNGQTYEVLREKRTEITNTIIEAKTGILGYLDITGLIRPQVPDLASFFGQQDPVVTYYYWTDTEKEAVAIVTVDEEETPTAMTFIQADSVNSTRGPNLFQARVDVYPNPAFGRTTFEVRGLDPGVYTLRLVNVLGRKVSTTQFTPVGDRTQVDVDLSGLPRGTYLYSLTNERGRILTTRRLLVGR